MPTLQTVNVLLDHYGYFFLFPIAILEGPIVTVMAAFLAFHGYMNLFLVYLVVIAADIFGDLIFYAFGRWNVTFIIKHGHFFGITEERLKKAEEYYIRHRRKSIIISKTIHGIGVVGLVAAGALKVPYRKFFSVALAVSLVQSAVFIGIGFFLGRAYSTVGKYLNYFAATTTLVVVVAIGGFLLYRFNRNE